METSSSIIWVNLSVYVEYHVSVYVIAMFCGLRYKTSNYQMSNYKTRKIQKRRITKRRLQKVEKQKVENSQT